MPVKQTFIQKVLRRPSRRYATTTTTTGSGTASPLTTEQPRTGDYHSTKKELVRIAQDLQIQATQHHRSKQVYQDHAVSSFLDEPAHHPRGASSESSPKSVNGVGPDSIPWQTESSAPNDSSEVFYTPTPSPASSPPQHCDPQTPQHLSPTETPPLTPSDSPSSSTASLGSTLHDSPEPMHYSTSYPHKSSPYNVTMVPISSPSPLRRKLPPERKLTYTDEDWAKDVRWLVAPQVTSSSGKQKRKMNQRSGSLCMIPDPSARLATNTPSARYPYLSTPSQHPPSRAASSKGLGHPKPKSPTARAVIGMTALVEVEEPLDEFSGSRVASPPNLMSARKRSQSLSNSPTPIQERPPPLPLSQLPKPRAGRLTRQRSSSLPSLGIFPDTTATERKLVLSSGYSTPSYSHCRTASTVTSRPTSPLSHLTTSTTKSPYTSAPSNALDALAAHVSVSDEPDALPSSGTRGFTSLVLPRAAPTMTLETNYSSKPSTRGRRSSTVLGEAIGIGLGFGDGVDLTRAGLAQTTMASVEVVRGIAGESTRADRKGGKNRGSVFGVGWFAAKDHGDKKGKDSESSLGFTSHRPPPGYVGGNAVLVQVWAVGLDGTDARLVGVPSPRIAVPGPPGIRYGRKVAKASEKEKLRTPPVGYIPGRSFVGRVLEAGWEVREDTVKRGDWVVGLASVQKCGALAEFVLVDRHRIHRVPQPHVLRRTPYSADNPAPPLAIGHVSVSRDAVAGRGASLPSGTDVLTVEELALLPLSGVPAYRAIRTFPQVSGPMGAAHRQGLAQSTLRPLVPPVGDGGVFPDSQGGDVPAAHQARDSRPRALVLRGHDGPGALAVQILVREGWCVWAHVPVPFALPGPALEVTGELRDEEEEKESEKRRAALRRIEERLRGWGVDEVLFVSVTSLRPSSAGGRTSMSSSTHSVHASPHSSSSSSQSLSPSPFSSSSGSVLSPPSSSSPASSGHQQSSASTVPFPLPFLQPYSYTSLPLSYYDTEQGSVAALLVYLTRCCVRVDAVLDTVGGREVWEVGRALLSLPVQEWEVTSNYGTEQTRGEGQAQFTTLLGDAPDRVVASAGDNFKAGVRALGIGGAKDYRQSKTLDLHDPFDALSCGGRNAYDSFSLPETKGKVRNTIKKKVKPRAVNYSWVSLASDIDWEGGDVCDSLREVLKLAVDYGVRPAADQLDFPSSLYGTSASDKGKKKAVLIGGDSFDDEAKVVPFENTPELFVSGGKLEYGGTVVSRIVG